MPGYQTVFRALGFSGCSVLVTKAAPLVNSEASRGFWRRVPTLRLCADSLTPGRNMGRARVSFFEPRADPEQNLGNGSPTKKRCSVERSVPTTKVKIHRLTSLLTNHSKYVKSTPDFPQVGYMFGATLAKKQKFG